MNYELCHSLRAELQYREITPPVLTKFKRRFCITTDCAGGLLSIGTLTYPGRSYVAVADDDIFSQSLWMIELETRHGFGTHRQR